MEVVGPDTRRWTGCGWIALWALGMMALSGMAYFLRDWQHLQLASAVLTVPFLSYYWLIPESPRWLLSQNRRAEAEAILRKTAQVNGVALPAGVLCRVRIEREQSGVSVLRACTSPVLVARHAILFFSWMVTSLTYYGLSWNVGSLHGDVYVNVLLLGVMELAAVAFCFLMLDRVGRRPLNCGLLLVAGITCTATILPVRYGSESTQWVTVLLAMIGKLAIGGCFCTIYIFSSELFSTVLRNSGIGACSVCARVGGIIAPYIVAVGTLVGGDAAKALPLVIYGVSSIAAGLLMLLLPETLRASLPETMEDALRMSRKKKTPTKQSN